MKRDILGNFIHEGTPKPKRIIAEKKAKAQVKQFLDKIRIKSEQIKSNTFKIIRTLDKFKLPIKGDQLRIRMQTQLNLISIVLKIVHQHEAIEELTISTYTLNKEAFEILVTLLKNGGIKKLNLFVASSYSFREPKYFEYLKSTCLLLSSKYKISLVIAWSHFKITLAKCGFEYYQLEGSMNYSTNNMAEQILFCNDKDVYEFDYDFIKNISKKSTNKALEIIC